MSVPVTVLCGELGAGKTTLLSALLESTDREIAVLVNDVGSVNVDADLVEARTDLRTGEEVVALENGCICCSLGGELSRSVIQLWKEHDFEYLVVEASGVGEPEPIARQFVRGPAGGPYDLDAVVTVVDARRFHDRFAATGAIDDAGVAADDPPERQGPDETGSRPLGDLLLEQVEFCDLLVVNKCDLVSETERERVVGILETLQPRAEIVTTEYGSLEPDALLESGRFDLEAAAESAGWKRAIEADADDREGSERDHDDDGHDHEHDHWDGGHESDDGANEHDHSDHEHAHPPERYGIEVDTYHRRRPFHPERFEALLADLPAGLVRAKGLCWIAGRDRQAITMSYAGSATTLEVTGRWIASLSEERREQYRRAQDDLSWDEEWGDRETRLALIGRDLSMDDLHARLDDCLLTDAEMDADWSTFENAAPTGMGESVTISSDE
ncbi:cobalamin synthesis protein P47K [Haloterrigena turkmenica DSM 5511]|uniref:Cobalamin synthesis protein P47K n=1 Tax=Haloterrigena turkmenica (strain ATCC 51198 / DSM 5511 / JCM 9101 / NCIMB 13204 / VKM B-1734 / 4k) TaxID=543526 RepID=D2RV29_HALTV|nr:GTP-binding protein [Haloterrigena turkmenica]ADB59322.1 cobalamin synthesis protein P47K [Haloterrigena turkmenica DSM 5511]